MHAMPWDFEPRGSDEREYAEAGARMLLLMALLFAIAVLIAVHRFA
jgi:hypothetical protein